MSYGTRFVETEMLLATQYNDGETTSRIGRDMLSNERAALRDTCQRLINYLDILDHEERLRNTDPIPGVLLF